MGAHSVRECRGWTSWRAPAILGVVSAALLFLAVGPALAAPPPTIPGATYVGSDTCKGCHEEYANKLHGAHSKLLGTKLSKGQLQARGCEACHGPGSKHMENQADPATIIRFGKKSSQPTDVQSGACLQCHERGKQMLWAGSAHDARDVTCASCHTAHGPAAGAQLKVVKPVERFDSQMLPMARVQFDLCSQCHQTLAMQFKRSSHMPMRDLGEAGTMTCSSCHNPHGTVTPKLIAAPSVNQNCWNCHANKRGPHLWQHVPVIENCLNCHQAHGSNVRSLLKMQMPRLCQQCHTQSGHDNHPYSPAASTPNMRMYNRSCVNCHFNIHGSNHPSGTFFNR